MSRCTRLKLAPEPFGPQTNERGIPTFIHTNTTNVYNNKTNKRASGV